VGLTDRETFKATLAATLVKEARDEETFNRIFNLYFLDLEALGEGLKKALGPEDPRVQDQLDQVMDQENLDLDELTELLMRGQGSEMEMAIRDGGQGAGLERLMYFLQVGYFSRRISDQFDWSAIERDIEKIMQALEARGLDPGQLRRIRNYLELRPGGVSPHDPAARAARAGAPRVSRRREAHAGRSWPTSRCSR
jgi:uncharacterized protein with von Willebrand factor type A (vWA) domain